MSVMRSLAPSVKRSTGLAVAWPSFTISKVEVRLPKGEVSVTLASELPPATVHRFGGLQGITRLSV